MILIRADGNARIGLGHLMRCLTIAEELAQQGERENICFVCADEASGAFVRENGFRSHVLGTDYRDMESELPLWKAVWEALMPERAFFNCAGEYLLQEEIQAGGVLDRPGQDRDGTRGSESQGQDRGGTRGFESQGQDGGGTCGSESQGLDGTGECGLKMGTSGTDACLHKQATVLVDSYYVTDLYLEALSRTAYTVLMDDYGTHCYPVDCVINYNAPADLEAYRKLYGKTGARLLIGSRYTPLRRQFRRPDAEVIPNDARAGIGSEMFRRPDAEEVPHNAVPGIGSEMFRRPDAERESQDAGAGIGSEMFKKTDTGPVSGTGFEGAQNKNAAVKAEKTGQDIVREVLITTGGGDSGNIAGKILKRIYSDNFTFHLVTGRFHPNFRELQELEKKHDNIEIHHDVKDMAGLMRRCQIALTAGGATIYELAALGVPFIGFSYAENQEALVEYIGEKQIAGSAGAWHKEPEQTLERIGVLFEKLVGDPEERECYRSREKRMVDGEGAERLARELLKIDGKDADGSIRRAGQEPLPMTVQQRF